MDRRVKSLDAKPKCRGSAFDSPLPNLSSARGGGLIAADGSAWRNRVEGLGSSQRIGLVESSVYQDQSRRA